MTQPLLQFECSSGVLHVSDPSFDKSVAEHARNFSVAHQYKCEPGLWNVQVTMDDPYLNRVQKIVVWHSDEKEPPTDDQWKLNGSIGVDSSTASICDALHYPEHAFKNNDPKSPEEVWMYNPSRTSHSRLWNSHGILTRSGFGDGLFKVYTHSKHTSEDQEKYKNSENQPSQPPITALQIVFIDQEMRDNFIAAMNSQAGENLFSPSMDDPLQVLSAEIPFLTCHELISD